MRAGDNAVAMNAVGMKQQNIIQGAKKMKGSANAEKPAKKNSDLENRRSLLFRELLRECGLQRSVLRASTMLSSDMVYKDDVTDDETLGFNPQHKGPR